MRSLTTWISLVMAIGVSCASGAEPPQQPAKRPSSPLAFIKTYCIDCHSAADPSGEREFETLDLSKSHTDNQLLLQEMIDQLTLGTMPPEDGEQPSQTERLAAIRQFTGRLAAMRQETVSTQGRTVLRRLSRREYRRTVGDLLGIDMTMFDPTLEFPGDNLTDGFDNIGDALVTSGHLLERYLEAADRSVEKALALSSPPEVQSWTFQGDFYQQPELATGHKQAFKNRYICLYDHPYNDKTEGGYGYVSEFRKGVPVDGVYEVRVLAKAMHRDTPYGPQAVRIDVSEPFRMGIRPGDTSLGDMYHRQPIQPKLAEQVIAGDEFKWYTFQVPLDRGFAPRFTFENGIHDFRGTSQRVYRFHGETLPAAVRKEQGIFRRRIAVIEHGQVPHIRISEVEIRGPIDMPWPTPSQRLLLGGPELEEQRVEASIERFAARAFRRPVTAEEVAGFVQLYKSRENEGHPPLQAFKDTLKAVLCSPAFLYFQTADGDSSDTRTLTQHGLAERLSYFLTSTMPDETLRKLADDGQLDRPEVLRQEVRRLLADPASDAFIADFLDSWLDLRSLGSMPPDPGQFWFYYAAGLEAEMKQETRLFLRDLIDRDAAATEMLSADYSFINRDLAKLYGVVDRVSPERAGEFRRVQFADPQRGGLLSQASLLTVSANGIETSPVVRGVYLLERILGTPTPPPPDDVPAIDPDTRGATSVRDQLTRHRADAACYQCHRRIDPLGFALEGFDPIGRSRTFYDAKRKLKIDTSGELPGGKSFTDVAEFKQRLLERKRFFVRTFCERLLMHALGRRIEPLDRGAVDAILASVADEDYPTASLIEAIVLSDLFRR